MKHVALEFDDGRRFEADVNPKTWDGLSTREAFKRQFGIPLDFMGLYSTLFAADEDGERHFDPSQLSTDVVQMLPDTQVALAFMAWMELKRRCEGVPDGPWDQVVEQIVAFEPTDDDDEDPT